MGTTARSLPALLALVALLLVPVPVTTAAAAVAEEEDPGQLLLMLDASGSMKEPDPSGSTKMVAAKRALTSVVDTLPDDSTVGLRVYGDRSDSCTDSRLVAPLATLDRAALRAAIMQTEPTGETPIAYSLRQAVEDLGPEGRRTIVLVSDGEETCAPEPCKAVRALVGSGIDLRIDTVGFGVGPAARDQLRCIAEAGGGTYYDAADAEALTASLGKLSQRATRPFTVTGEPVEATELPEEGPELEPGQYTDRFAVGTPVRYYQLVRRPGSTVRFSVVSRPLASADPFNRETLTIDVRTPEGEQCASERGSRFDPAGLTQALVVDVQVDGLEEAAGTTATPSSDASASPSPTTSPTTSPITSPTASPAGVPADPCVEADRLVVGVQRLEGGAPVPVEVLYVEEPPVTNLGDLPEPLDAATIEPLVAPAEGRGTPVVGGGGFSDALPLAPGTYRETLLPGEQIFYRVAVQHGQAAAFTVDLPAPGEAVPRSSYLHFDLQTYTPARAELTDTGSLPSLGPSTASLQESRYVPEVRYRNRAAAPTSARGYSYVNLRKAAVAGDYYFVVSRAAAEPGTPDAEPITLRLRTAVTGEPTGAPTYDGADPTADESPAAEEETSAAGGSEGAASDADGGSALPWVLGGVGLVVVLAVVAGLLVRRRA
ncbi:VWA domain-containing protein [Nocardioides sp. IC4_145]|uniref:VWA domain-containing protein n=1 Tax=Nocardioides sp. IC4_145 TaxID=2714037 RepID=UPI00140A2D61|nr:VWA domain-containing protein [Nocardioides sp. IC4_145]NHC23487.1 VWA domain-containing protein [Nocardioides sp. IC4_145]